MNGKTAITSKTVGTNTAVVAVSWLLSTAFGVTIPAEVAVTGLGLINVLLRFITKDPIISLF